jgi:hypothetical protein
MDKFKDKTSSILVKVISRTKNGVFIQYLNHPFVDKKAVLCFPASQFNEQFEEVKNEIKR